MAALVLLCLGGDYILRNKRGESDLAGVHEKENSAPSALRNQPEISSRRTTTYVFAAPDFNRRTGSIGKSARVGFSRTLEEEN